MKRRYFLGHSMGGALAGISLAQGQQTGGAADAAESTTLLRTPAVLMAPRTDGVDVICAVSRLARCRVEWREEEGESRILASDPFGFVPQSQEIFKHRLHGLKPGTRYAVRVTVEAIDGEAATETSEWALFRTLDPDAETSRFVVWNDTHENAATLAKLHEVTPEADFLAWNGDTTNDWHESDWLVPVLLNPGGQPITNGRPLCLTFGNHDVRGKYAFKLDETVAVPDGRPFYGFRSGPVAVLFLHTGEDKPDDHPSFRGRVAFQKLREEQAEWIREITARPEFRDAPHKVVFCHIPLRWTSEPEVVDYAGSGYDRFSRASRELWHEALVDWGAQVVVSGHTHRDAWLPATEEFPYAQLIGGGPQLERARWIEGLADGETLRLVMRDLGGEVIHDLSLPRA